MVCRKNDELANEKADLLRELEVKMVVDHGTMEGPSSLPFKVKAEVKITIELPTLKQPLES